MSCDYPDSSQASVSNSGFPVLSEFLLSSALLATLDPLNNGGRGAGVGMKKRLWKLSCYFYCRHTIPHMGTIYRGENAVVSALASTTMSHSAGHSLLFLLCLLACEIRSPYVAQAGLELRSFLPQPPKSWPPGLLLLSSMGHCDGWHW